MTYVLDSSAWYALVLENEIAHQHADQIMQGHPELIIPYPVVEELTALIHHRVNKLAVVEHIFQSFYLSPFTTIKYLDTDTDRQIWQLYQSFPNKIDYVDASVYYFARKLKLPIFTFDSHFQELRPKPHLVP